MKIAFSPPDITDAEIAEVVDALKSGWITTGPKTKQLEREIAAYCGVNKSVCLNSQTACAETALRVLDIGEGDEVITTAYTYTATASVIVHVGAKPVLVDTLPNSVEPDYEQIERAVTTRTKAIIPVDVAGIPVDYDRLFDIVTRKKSLFKPANAIQESIGRVIILSDSAHSFGATYGGTKTGNIADFSAFSFHAVKNFTTAEGGALTWRHIDGVDDEEIYHKAQLLSLHGQDKDALAKTKLGAWEYDIIGPWYKCNMTDIAAALGLAQMNRYDELLARRKHIVEAYDAAFRPLGVATLDHYTKKHTSSGHLYITRVPNITSETRNKMIISMAEKGVACNVHYKPLPMLTAYKNMGFDISDYPNAYTFFANEITLPLHTLLTDADALYVIDAFTATVKEFTCE